MSNGLFDCPDCGKRALFESKSEGYPPGWYCWRAKGGCGRRFAPDAFSPPLILAPRASGELIEGISFVDQAAKIDLSQMAEQEKVQWLRSRYRKDLYALAVEVLGYRDLRLNQKLFRGIAHWVTTWRKDRRIKLLLAPRGYFKTSLCNVSYSIQRILNNPNITILNSRANEANVRSTMKEIRDHLGHNEILRALFPEIKPSRPWTDEKFSIVRTIESASCTMESGGVYSAQTSMHYGTEGDLAVIFDDLEDKETCQSPITREKPREAFYHFFHLTNHATRRLGIGTRWDMDDLYGHAMDEFPDLLDTLIISSEDEQGHSTFPIRFPDQLLSEMKAVNYGNYSTVMMQDPLDQKNAAITEVMLKEACVKIQEFPTENMIRGVMWDPGVASELEDAWRKQRTRGHGFGLSVGFKDSSDTTWITHSYREKMGPIPQMNFVLDIIRIVDPLYVYVEKAACQAAYMGWLMEKRNELGLRFVILGVGSTNVSKDYRLQVLASRIAAGKVKIADHLTKFREELIRYPKGKFKDCMDSSAWLVEELPRAGKGEQQITETREQEKERRLDEWRRKPSDADMNIERIIAEVQAPIPIRAAVFSTRYR